MENDALTHKWIPRVEQREKNLFTEEYYSSTDTKIYIDEEEQTEIGYISYTVQEQLKPIYGYASRTFDDMAVGNRIVSGAFKVPIKNPTENSSLAELNTWSDEENTIGDVLQYNSLEKDTMRYVDWIFGSSGKVTIGLDEPEPDRNIKKYKDNPDYIYTEKLELLGYKYDRTILFEQAFAEQIKKFEKDHKLEFSNYDSTQYLLELTKRTIDEELQKSTDNKSIKTVEIPSGTNIYFGPKATIYRKVKTLDSNSQAYIIGEKYEDGWVKVVFMDNTIGFVNIKQPNEGDDN